MPKIISVHSFRGGTGKSNTTANVACVLAAEGLRVGVVDTDIQSPGIHVLFGLSEESMAHSLNDYLWGKCTIEQTACDVTPQSGSPISGKLFLIPSSIEAGEIVRVLRDGYDVSLLNDGMDELIEALDLDVLLIDTHPGLSEETLLSIAISDALAIILRPDEQDYQGTSVTVEVARMLEVPRMVLIINKLPSAFDITQVKANAEEAYECEVAAVLPHSEEMMTLASSDLFVLRYPNHPVTAEFQQVAARLMADPD
jgi:MinD-like ATPase involved in chromosome partitioning or flagellar assembly